MVGFEGEDDMVQTDFEFLQSIYHFSHNVLQTSGACAYREIS